MKFGVKSHLKFTPETKWSQKTKSPRKQIIFCAPHPQFSPFTACRPSSSPLLSSSSHWVKWWWGAQNVICFLVDFVFCNYFLSTENYKRFFTSNCMYSDAFCYKKFSNRKPKLDIKFDGELEFQSKSVIRGKHIKIWGQLGGWSSTFVCDLKKCCSESHRHTWSLVSKVISSLHQKQNQVKN